MTIMVAAVIAILQHHMRLSWIRLCSNPPCAISN